MKPSLLHHLPIWVFCFSLFPAFNQARISPLLSPTSGPLLSPQLSPFSSTPVRVAQVPFGMQTEGGDQQHHLDIGSLLVIIVPVIVGLIILISFCGWILRRKHSKKCDLKVAQSTDGAKGLALGPIFSKLSSFKSGAVKKGSIAMIEYTLLESATNNFSSSDILGEGGFGFVYKAHFDENSLAAVKKIDCGGQDSDKEFENEVDLMSRIKHPNIVSLLGYCIHGSTRLLVYELMQNGSLETQLHGIIFSQFSMSCKEKKYEIQKKVDTSLHCGYYSRSFSRISFILAPSHENCIGCSKRARVSS